LLAQEPGIGSPCESKHIPGVRRLLLSRIRYFVYYRATSETLDVLAVWHVSRDQQPSV
jgi:plasmid stabilization system protein ParE